MAAQNFRRGNRSSMRSFPRMGLDNEIKERGARGKIFHRRTARFKFPKGEKIDYKNLNLLQKFLTDRGKILSSRMSGISAKEQRKLTESVKRARFLGLLPVGSAKRR